MTEFMIWGSPTTYLVPACLLAGAIISILWSVQFRRLRATVMDPDDLLWEARRAAVFGGGWICLLFLIFTILQSHSHLSAVESVPYLEHFSGTTMDYLHKSMTINRVPMLVTMTLAAIILVVSGWLSGALRILLRHDKDRRVRHAP